MVAFFFSSRRRHTRFDCDWSSDVCSSDLWYAPDAWGGVVNPQAKYLLLRHAFEDWRAIRVALKTDVKNVHSQAAIKKLGARFEGTLRNQRIRPDGSYRDTVMFSIIESEWPPVKARLRKRLATFASAPRHSR